MPDMISLLQHMEGGKRTKDFFPTLLLLFVREENLSQMPPKIPLGVSVTRDEPHAPSKVLGLPKVGSDEYNVCWLYY